MQFRVATIALLVSAVAGAALPAEAEAGNEARGLIEARANGDITWYNVGLGACGKQNVDTDLIVALNKADFDPHTPNGNPNNNKLCGKKMRVSYNGKSVDVTLRDRCAGCKKGDVDLSPAAFKKLAPLGNGRVKGSWKWL
ncbi:hypothetical protein GGTG_03481 [Gaeumannomyces tritici R3-111a-1]|uniref:RlpA-like protein double-psi beta-barrel domain-containing protein n=1 Tax=Gaeumannomyces tritici (strain R3-111a-1) TaxID=644352 RepID=J3NQC4_GAET3|nr:hypothetical protein GGTG_03481 [Gaeumannomyces tritici R3-111a-1]EJT78380.1 hypothetical protein GGTG_03481 [Gaeumannomyces tritici R3-111a-1]